MKSLWRGVIPAITTPFREDYSIDYEAFASHCRWMAESGCTGVVIGGSLGEGGSLTLAEKGKLIAAALTVPGLHVILGVSALTTKEAEEIARTGHGEGAHGLMVLPPYVYIGDWRETKAHVSALCHATPLPCMLYNNPIAYTTDFVPQQVVELLDANPTLHAIKESAADVRRVTDLRALAEGRLEILVGVDDLIVEGVAAGAVGWIAGLVNAFPRESVELFELARAGRVQEAFDLYRWFLPLLRMDTVPKFVHLIKFAQQEVGRGVERLRPPRLPLVGEERDQAAAVLKTALAARPSLAPAILG
ncbi:MAG TPA: dihydrodipicolinate synthase family protein [Solibacterales bacterium]|nr:dihydrodipicolinate synthase family protein [Bryobacterales bacterium]